MRIFSAYVDLPDTLSPQARNASAAAMLLAMIVSFNIAPACR
jgi:hypothetical protein